MVLFFTHIPFMVNHTFNATPLERLQQVSEGEQEFENFSKKGCFLSFEW